MSGPYSNVKLLLFGAAVGTLYGVLIRFAFGARTINQIAGVMSVAFLFVMPFVCGFIAVYFAEIRQQQSAVVWFLVPWLTILGGCVVMLLFVIEGWICIIMY